MRRLLAQALALENDGSERSKAVLDHLEAMATVQPPLHRGDVLVKEGEPAASVFIVRSGVLKGEVLDEDGSQRVTSFYLRPDFADVQSFFLLDHGCRVTALDATSVVALPIMPMLELARSHELLQAAVHRAIGRVWLRFDKTVHLLLSRTVTARIAGFYSELAERYAAIGNSPNALHFPALRGEVASYLEMDPASFSRGIRSLQERGLISFQDDEVLIPDVAALRKEAGTQRAHDGWAAN